MDDIRTTAAIREGQRGPAVLKLKRKPVAVRNQTPATKGFSGRPQKKASLVLATLSIPA
jgi:hypothetical protein